MGLNANCSVAHFTLLIFFNLILRLVQIAEVVRRFRNFSVSIEFKISCSLVDQRLPSVIVLPIRYRFVEKCPCWCFEKLVRYRFFMVCR
jgi:hypothetical protein